MTIPKTNIKIKGKSVPIDNFFLNALSLKYFDLPYSECKEDANKKLREIIADLDDTHPQLIHQKILEDFLTKKVKNELKKVDIYKPL